MQRSEAVCEAVFTCPSMPHHESVKLGIIPLSHASWTEVGIKITVSAEPRCWCELWTSLKWITFLSLLLCGGQREEICVHEASSPLWYGGTCIQLCGLLCCDQLWSHPVMHSESFIPSLTSPFTPWFLYFCCSCQTFTFNIYTDLLTGAHFLFQLTVKTVYWISLCCGHKTFKEVILGFGKHRSSFYIF